MEVRHRYLLSFLMRLSSGFSLSLCSPTIVVANKENMLHTFELPTVGNHHTIAYAGIFKSLHFIVCLNSRNYAANVSGNCWFSKFIAYFVARARKNIIKCA